MKHDQGISENIAFGVDENTRSNFEMFLKWIRNSENSTPETEYRKVSREDLEFYAGRQDTPEVLEELANQNRPNDTYNEIKPKIDMLCGLAAQVKTNFGATPVTLEDEAFVQIANAALKHFSNKAKKDDVETDAVSHVAKAGRCLIEILVNTDNPFEPKIQLKLHKGHTFLLDPNFQEYDLSDCKYIVIDRWLCPEDIAIKYPGFDVETAKALTRERGSAYPEFWDEASEKVRLSQVWYRKLEAVYWVLSPVTGKPEAIKVKDYQKYIDSINQINADIAQGNDVLRNGGVPLQVSNPVKGFKSFIYTAILSGSGILEESESTYSHEDYPFVFMGAYMDDNRNNWFSAITMMKDPARGVNTIRRQLVHMLNTSPKGILIHESGAVLDIEEYEKRGSDPTYHMEVASGKLDKVKFTNQPQINPIYESLDAVFTQGMKDTSGIQDSLMGIQTTSREPGVTVRMRQETGIAVLYVFLHNITRTRRELVRKLFPVIQQYCDQPTLLRIEGQQGLQLLQINSQMNPQLEGFNDISAWKFDFEVDEVAESTTMRNAIAQYMNEYAAQNPGAIPPDIILEYAGIPYEAKMRIKQYNELRIAQEDAIKRSEIAIEQQRLALEAEDRKIAWAEVEIKQQVANKPTPKPAASKK